MTNHIKDLIGTGEVIRQLRRLLMDVLNYRSSRKARDLKDEAQQLKNEEQRIKNWFRRLQYVESILGLASRYECTPEQLQILMAATTESGGNAPPPAFISLKNTRISLSRNQIGSGGAEGGRDQRRTTGAEVAGGF